MVIKQLLHISVIHEESYILIISTRVDKLCSQLWMISNLLNFSIIVDELFMSIERMLICFTTSLYLTYCTTSIVYVVV